MVSYGPEAGRSGFPLRGRKRIMDALASIGAAASGSSALDESSEAGPPPKRRATGRPSKPEAEKARSTYWSCTLGEWSEEQRQVLREKGADRSYTRRFAMCVLEGGQLRAGAKRRRTGKGEETGMPTGRPPGE